ncbi:virulence protein [Helicobacter sp. MIT 11-5569]|uniref:type IV secretion system protein n=1 Tax=Helicobacter sp. MIT 11-5569 TaxID=1548151 RepID=UPI00051FC79A|nr:VirB8/TrbF family protein [Helicobacter sp. MIT 11-5569]TLD85192.1 virulence protein [Helicobacter sp. MIT 11-5569]
MMKSLKDPNYIFQLEKNITKILFLLVIALTTMLTLAILAIAILLPLKETKPYLVFFSDPQGSFFRVETEGFNVRSDVALLKSLLAGYVLKRETINRIDDDIRYREIALQSDNKVYGVFQKAVTQQGSIYQTRNLYREIEIINSQLLSNDIASVEFIAITRQGELQTGYQRYKATLKFGFETREIAENAIPLNPTGFKVYEYALSKVNVETLNPANPKNNK